MKRIIVIIIATLVVAAPATAGTTLTRNEAWRASNVTAEGTLGTLDYHSVGSAWITVSGCRVHSRRGHCHVVVHGIQRCEYTSHVLKVGGNFMAWGTGIRCD